MLNIFIIFSFSDYDISDLSKGYYIDPLTNQQVNITKEMIWTRRMQQPHLMGMSSYSYEETRGIIQKCGILMIVCAGFVVLFFLCKKAPLYIEQSWGKDKEKEEEGDEETKKRPLSIRIFQFITRLATCIIKFFFNIDVIYYVSYAVIAILGATVHEFFFCFHLTELFFR